MDVSWTRHNSGMDQPRSACAWPSRSPLAQSCCLRQDRVRAADLDTEEHVRHAPGGRVLSQPPAETKSVRRQTVAAWLLCWREAVPAPRDLPSGVTAREASEVAHAAVCPISEHTSPGAFKVGLIRYLTVS